jgi:hypothetical protein
VSKPYIHAKSSARRFGGTFEDYIDIHAEMDSSKSALADVRHRAVYHSAFGIYVIERIFGQTRVNTEGKTYSVRDIAEQHVMEDLGKIPTLQDWMQGAPIEPWMTGKKEVKSVRRIPLDLDLTARGTDLGAEDVLQGYQGRPSIDSIKFID